MGTSYKPKGYWKDPDNRRKFFLDFARDMEFDPYQARNWLHITKSQIAARKVLNIYWFLYFCLIYL